MSFWTLSEAKNHLSAWMAADLALSQSKEYEIDGRKLKRSDAEEVRGQIKFWSQIASKLQNGGGIRTARAIPRDL